ncbi:30S ribosomal protein S9 [Candidatus Bathyarchaeota archaeon]|nr:30S ribosomal protein S9 [Candidatus Bathyarchaeota archaeon]NIU81257.1 30S ribosomal protein S9 [Candidatus Bathyarchaeota archaeon]NIV68420.1 30S ribosomal protein S9 [Candidatus Bathyarchaeota archaeon]NIW16719.1 30S ribosomal protein S9 [Candidatus Bathyarchaeota archaeon]NIW34919.1 30S ribosomal protein S9 [Candidatus Bathyarchaeota archaeon]
MPSRERILLTSGKRKTAIARATVRSGKGRVRINNVPLEIYEPKIARDKIREPLLLLDQETLKEIDINIKVSGGGFMGQAEASRMAIARALSRWTKSTRLESAFKDYDRSMIAGDSRRKESSKFGGPGARARYQKSYR